MQGGGRRLDVQPVGQRRVRQLADAGPAGPGGGAPHAARVQGAAEPRDPRVRLRALARVPDAAAAVRRVAQRSHPLAAGEGRPRRGRVGRAGRRRRVQRRPVRPERAAHQLRQRLGAQVLAPVHHLVSLLDRGAPRAEMTGVSHGHDGHQCNRLRANQNTHPRRRKNYQKYRSS